MRNDAGMVSITIVTYNSEAFIARCLDSVFAQDWPQLQVIVVDNNSADGTRSILTAYGDRVEIVLNAENRGFAAAQNQAIRQARGDWILTLNPDVMLAPAFISLLLRGAKLHPHIGTVCGKLLRASRSLGFPTESTIDSAGMYFTPTFRHLDRGSNLPDTAEYQQPAFVFGATAAAALYSRNMIEDVSVDGEFFDEDFFLYREDADVAWRAQLLGWRCWYVPDAVGYHVRTVLPELRSALPPALNRLSVQNRFLMRIKNVTAALYFRYLLPVTVRDVGIVIYCILRERSSLGAFVSVIRLWRRMFAKRRAIQQRRRATDRYIQQWFRFRPVTMPIENVGHTAESAESAQENRQGPPSGVPQALGIGGASAAKGIGAKGAGLRG